MSAIHVMHNCIYMEEKKKEYTIKQINIPENKCSGRNLDIEQIRILVAILRHMFYKFNNMNPNPYTG